MWPGCWRWDALTTLFIWKLSYRKVFVRVDAVVMGRFYYFLHLDLSEIIALARYLTFTPALPVTSETCPIPMDYSTSNINNFIKATTNSITDGRWWGSFWYSETGTAGQRLKWLYSWIVNTRPAWRFMFKFHGYEHLNCTIVRLPRSAQPRPRGWGNIIFMWIIKIYSEACFWLRCSHQYYIQID